MPAAALTVVTGTEELLVSRQVAGIIAEVRDADPGAEVHDLDATDLDAARLAELASPSLFGGTRLVVVRGVAEAGKDTAAILAAYAANPTPDVVVVATHSGAAKGKSALEVLRQAGARVVDCPAPRWAEDRERFVVEEVRGLGGDITREAAQALLAAVGTDLRELANSCAQLVSDSAAQIDEAVVARYHRGRADTGSFTIADRAVEGDAAGALELLRWGLSVGQSPAGVTAALALNLRTIALVAAAGRGGRPQEIASELKLPLWKVRKAQGWARGWRPDDLADALIEVARADAEVKGSAADPGYAAERVVLQVAARGIR